MNKNILNGKTGKRLETSFREVKPLYSHAEAALEAHRCLFCFDAPCIKACPAEIDIPAFIKKIATGNIRGSAKKILEPNLLGLSTGHVCPVEELCAGACVYNDYNGRPINIGRLQRYSVEKALELENHNGRLMFEPKPLGNRKAVLIGGGPASLACAAYLRLAGVKVTIYEKNSRVGGLNITGIAPYKMQISNVVREIEWLLNFGLDIKTGVEILAGDISKLRQENDAVFIGVGLGNDNIVNIPGEKKSGVWGAVDLISKIKSEADFKLPESLEKVIVIGGGNTAIDIARELAVLGVNQVDILYRRTIREMRAYVHEFEGAKKYGVRLIENQKPLKISSTSAQSLTLTAENTKTGDKINYSCNWIVMAIGQVKIAETVIPGINLDSKGNIIVNQYRETSRAGVFAGGDCINGGKEVINAVVDGREAARAMLLKWGDIELNNNWSENG